jgi:hypothetical protein
MIFGNIFTISGKVFLNPFLKQSAKILGPPEVVHLEPRMVADSGTRGPTYHTPDRGELTGGENSPTLRSPAKR